MATQPAKKERGRPSKREEREARQAALEAERQEKAWQLRKGGASHKQIAERLGVSDETIRNDLLAYHKRHLAMDQESYDEYRSLQLARTDDIILAFYQQAVVAPTIIVRDRKTGAIVWEKDKDGNLKIDKDGNPIPVRAKQQGQQIEAARVVLDAQAQQAKLLGLNAPERREIAGKDGEDLSLGGVTVNINMTNEPEPSDLYDIEPND